MEHQLPPNHVLARKARGELPEDHGDDAAPELDQVGALGILEGATADALLELRARVERVEVCIQNTPEVLTGLAERLTQLEQDPPQVWAEAFVAFLEGLAGGLEGLEDPTDQEGALAVVRAGARRALGALGHPAGEDVATPEPDVSA